MQKNPRLTLAAALILLSGLLPVACGAPRTEEPAAETGGAGQVEVRLTEFSIQLPQGIPAGTTTFLVHNQGTVQHNFEIEGQGLEAKLPEPLAPGASGRLEVTLPAGDYKVYCPVADHEGRGMTARLVVG